MNIQEFIDYNNVCPVCDNDKLSFTFHSRNKQILHRDSDNMIGIFDLNALKKGQSHFKFGVNINKNTCEFDIDFFPFQSIDETYFNEVPLFLINRFKKYHLNLDGNLKFYKECLICRGYNYQSQSFSLNLKSKKIETLNISWESWSYAYEDVDAKKNYTIRISNSTDKCNIFLKDNYLEREMILQNIPPIKFKSLEEASKKILLLKTFV